jgi:phage shock protein C
MNDYRVEQNRIWRSDRGAMLSGVCAGLAEDLDLPLPLLRLVGVVFMFLPTGLAYLALTMLLRRRVPQGQARVNPRAPSASRPASPRATPAGPIPENFALLAHRFAALEPRLKRIEAFVTSNEFELHGGFRRMGE